MKINYDVVYEYLTYSNGSIRVTKKDKKRAVGDDDDGK